MPNEMSNIGRAYRAAIGAPETATYLSVASDFHDPAHALLRHCTPGGLDAFEIAHGHVRAARIIPHADEDDAKELGRRFKPERVTHWTPGVGGSRRFTIRVPGGIDGIAAALYQHQIPHAVMCPVSGGTDVHIFSHNPMVDAVALSAVSQALNGKVRVERGRVDVLTTPQQFEE